MSRLEYKWIFHGENVTKQSITPLLKDEINVVLIDTRNDSTEILKIIKVKFLSKKKNYLNKLIFLFFHRLTSKQFSILLRLFVVH